MIQYVEWTAESTVLSRINAASFILYRKRVL